MILNYIKSESTVYPELIDTTSSKKYVYLRKNIIEIEREENTIYQYEEVKLTKDEYKQYLQEMGSTETLEDIETLKAENQMLMEQVNMLTNCILEMSEMIYA